MLHSARQVRAHFLSKCFHKIVESARNKEILEWCSEAERKNLEKLLGAVSFAFTPNNPTGFHKLDLRYDRGGQYV